MLTTLTTVKNHLNLSGTTFDTVIERLISQVDSFIEKKTGVKAGNVSVSNEIVHSDGGLVLNTKFKPITALDSIEYRDSDGNWNAYTHEAINDVDFHEEWSEIYTRYVVTPKGRRNIRISYNCGYTDIPSDLELAATLIVTGLFNQRNQVGVGNQTALGLTQSIENFIRKDPVIMDILKRYMPIYAL